MSKTAVVFPGQGSQSVGMISDVIEQYPVAKQTLEQANDVLGFDLQTMIADGPADDLNSTQNTQPALVAVEVALWRALNKSLQAEFMAGHSLGEYSALVCAESLSFEDALRMVRRRGQLMQQAVPAGQGGMAAVLGMEDEQVEAICAELSSDKVVQPANYNGPGQLVIAGHAEAVEAAAAKCKEAGAKRAMVLPVSGPFHSSLMQPAADAFAEFISDVEVKAPKVPILQNASIELESEPERIRANLIAQIASPVNWTKTVQLLAQQGVKSIYEVGPGKVLTGLNKRIDKSLTSSVINNSDSIANVLA